jgi:hypothetical protein
MDIVKNEETKEVTMHFNVEEMFHLTTIVSTYRKQPCCNESQNKLLSEMAQKLWNE